MQEIGTPAATAALLRQHKICPSKALGQNFLVDGNLLDKIVALAQVGPEDGIIEIGPGLGALTQRLAARAGRVVAVEVDGKLFTLLRQQLAGEEKICLLHQDALSLDLAQVVAAEFTPEQRQHRKVVANIPYSITGPLVAKLLEELAPLPLVLMVQAEVAQRMAAVPGTKSYGSFSVLCQYYCQVQLALKVPASVFIPRPEVDSAVVVLTPQPQPLPLDQRGDFQRMVRTIFSVRRKTLVNGLLLLPELQGQRPLAEALLQDLGWAAKVRGETLAVGQLVDLYRQLRQHTGEVRESL